MIVVINEGKQKKIDVLFFVISVSGFLVLNVIEGKMIMDDVKYEVVVDFLLKEKGVKLGDMIKDMVLGKSFRIVGFIKNQLFSYVFVIYINLKEWIMFESIGVFNVVVLNMNSQQVQDFYKKEVDVNVISKDEVLKGIFGY